MSKQPEWRTGSYSGVNGNCVEVARLPAGAALRDSKHPDDAVLGFPSSEWRAFLSSLVEHTP
ncbi:DUF397 domain-containing protein [Nocardiopsis sp. RSe5-2]|uniref:DUF397 domain-containing protein n=1 Tax=Nocardiopsis endophytica TaxID=3018445 RepID=A0ABT4U134_9ACTN|nr:DUF397 domain-containing protein [Nocardiopsis endophytica]MDA2810654.1 DUF397 domain-containing protein [Nocardiopsis endophytica]